MSGFYVTENHRNGFTVKRRPHPLDVEGAPDWLVDFAYEHTGGRRPPVTVIAQPYCLSFEERWQSCDSICFPNFYFLLNRIAKYLMQGWEPVEVTCEHESCDCRPQRKCPDIFISKWIVKRTAWAINKIVHEQWKMLLQTVDPTVLAVQKKVFSACLWDARILQLPGLYENQYIVKDILTYRAAAIAAYLCSPGPEPVFYDFDIVAFARKFRSVPEEIENGSPELIEQNRSPEQIEQDLLEDAKVLLEDEQEKAREIADYEASKEQAIEKMTDWRRIYSPTGSSYTALNQTLHQLPGGIPADLISKLSTFVLPKAITSRVELIAILSAHGMENPRHLNTWLFAKEDQIKESLNRVARSTHQNLSTRRWRHIDYLVRYVNDFPEEHQGKLVGLTEKAIRWHRDCRQEEIDRVISMYGHGTVLPLPPIPLPDVAGVRFLATVGDLCQEDENMAHCIASYARYAVTGSYYFFHVDYRNERASVQVNYEGKVVQSQGPENESNAASRWGRKVLTQWGKWIRIAEDPHLDPKRLLRRLDRQALLRAE